MTTIVPLSSTTNMRLLSPGGVTTDIGKSNVISPNAFSVLYICVVAFAGSFSVVLPVRGPRPAAVAVAMPMARNAVKRNEKPEQNVFSMQLPAPLSKRPLPINIRIILEFLLERVLLKTR